MDKFFDRCEAAVILAKYLKEFANKPNVIILTLPRGGVPEDEFILNLIKTKKTSIPPPRQATGILV